MFNIFFFVARSGTVKSYGQQSWSLRDIARRGLYWLGLEVCDHQSNFFHGIFSHFSLFLPLQTERLSLWARMGATHSWKMQRKAQIFFSRNTCVEVVNLENKKQKGHEYNCYDYDTRLHFLDCFIWSSSEE